MRISDEDRVFLNRFTACVVRKEEFRHLDHVHLAWILLADDSLLTALLRFRALLKAFAAHHGVPGLYNETITCFYMLLIRDCMEQMGGTHGWESFKEANPELFCYPKTLLESYYPGGVAFSEQAKHAFLLPLVSSAEAA